MHNDTQDNHQWDEWDRQLKQACTRMPGHADQRKASTPSWDRYIGLRRLAYHLRDQLKFCCSRLSEARKNVAELEADAADVRARNTEQNTVINQQKAAEISSTRTLKRLQAALQASDAEARETILELQHCCTAANAERDELAGTLQASQEQLQSLVLAHRDVEQCVMSLQHEQAIQQELQSEMADELATQKEAVAQAVKLRQQYAAARRNAELLDAENAELRVLLAELGKQHAEAAAAVAPAHRSSSPQARLRGHSMPLSTMTEMHLVTVRDRGEPTAGPAAGMLGATQPLCPRKPATCFTAGASRSGGVRRPASVQHRRPQAAAAGSRGPQADKTRASHAAVQQPLGAQASAGSAGAAWVPKAASRLVQQFLADWDGLYGTQRCAGWNDPGTTGTRAVDRAGAPGGADGQELARMHAADALVVMLNEVFVKREAARVHALQERHRQRVKELKRQLQQQQGYEERIEAQRGAWASQRRSNWRQRAGADCCQGVLATSMGKSFAARELEQVELENAELRGALAQTSAALHSAAGACGEGAAWEWCQLGPALRQQEAALASCEFELLAVASKNGCSHGEVAESRGSCGSGEAAVVRGVAHRLSAVRRELRECRRGVQAEHWEEGASDSGAPRGLQTPALP
eukprot:jgi/Ulvmu1/6265/UM028_0123.1